MHETTSYWTFLVFITFFNSNPPWTGTKMKIMLKRKPAAQSDNYLPQQLMNRTEEISVTIHVVWRSISEYPRVGHDLFLRKWMLAMFMISKCKRWLKLLLDIYSKMSMQNNVYAQLTFSKPLSLNVFNLTMLTQEKWTNVLYPLGRTFNCNTDV